MIRFDPLETPEPDDANSRGTRLGTAASVLAMLLAAPPSRGMELNLRDTQMLDLWPLRDADSQAGVRKLRTLMAGGPLRVSGEYNALLGPGGCVPKTEAAAAGADANQGEQTLAGTYARYGFAQPHLQHFKFGHVANQVGFVGVLATTLAQCARENTDLSEHAHVLSTFLDDHAGPLCARVVKGIRSEGSSEFYSAVADLLVGFLKEAAALANHLTD